MDRRDFLKRGTAAGVAMSTDLLAVERPARLSAAPSGAAATDKAIVVENPEIRLTLGATGKACPDVYTHGIPSL